MHPSSEPLLLWSIDVIVPIHSSSAITTATDDSSSSELYALKFISKRRMLASREVQRTLTEQAVLRRMAIEGINLFVVKLRRSFYDEDHLYLAMVRLTYML